MKAEGDIYLGSDSGYSPALFNSVVFYSHFENISLLENIDSCILSRPVEAVVYMLPSLIAPRDRSRQI